MVRLTRIYTRGGDAGKTSLGDGQRVDKAALRVATYGTVDEANAVLGLARLHTADLEGIVVPVDGAGPDVGQTADDLLARIQNDLFDLGADLCVPEIDPTAAESSDGAARDEDEDEDEDGNGGDGEDTMPPPLRIVPAQVTRLEREIDAMNARLTPLSSFILPGGSAAAAHLHHARTVVRRAERLMAELAGVERVGAPALAYVNRLSDHLFVLARLLNDDGKADVLWVPGASR